MSARWPERGWQKQHPLRVIYDGIRKRCFNRNGANWARYGGRGITVHQRWMGPSGFRHFIADMGPRPSPMHSVDRINNDGNYAPDNCRWATRAEQTANSDHWDSSGSANGMARLTEAAVREIRSRRAAGETLKRLAATYGVDHSTIRRAAVGQTWGHIK